MNLATTLKLMTGDIQAESSGAMGPADSRSADEWIKKYLEDKALRLNDMRQKLLRTVDPHVHAAIQEGKYVNEQDISKIAEGGRWSVQSPDGLILSTHHDREDAGRAASAKRYAMVVDLGPDFEYRKKGPLGKRLKLNDTIDRIRSREVSPTGDSARYSTAGTGGVGTGSGL